MQTQSSGMVHAPIAASGHSRALALRALVTDFDALIRSVRSGGAVDAMATKIAPAWRELTDDEVLVMPTALRNGDVDLLRAQDVEGRWILPLFMAGARAMHSQPTLVAEDVIRLAEKLSTLQPDAASLEEFRDWLWTSGAEGFELELAPSFVEVMEVVSDEKQTAATTLMAVRGHGILSLDNAPPLTIANDDLDAAAVRPEFGVPLEILKRGHDNASFATDEAQRRDLAVAADRSTTWLDAEMSAVLAHPSLAAAVPPQRLARRISTLAARGLDAPLLRRLAHLSAQSDDVGRSVLKACEALGLDDVLSVAAVDTGPELSPALRAFIAVAPASLIEGALRGILRHATEHPETFDILVEIVEGVDAAPFLDHIEIDRLSIRQSQTLATAVLETDTGSSRLPALLARLPERSTAALLESVPPTLLGTLQPTVTSLLTSADDDVRESIALTLLRHADRRSLKMLRSAFENTPGGGWRRPTIIRLFESLRAARLERTFAVALARSRKTPADVRLAILDALAPDRDLLRAATRFRLAEVADPASVRSCLRTLRRAAMSQTRNAPGRSETAAPKAPQGRAGPQ